MTRPTCCVPSCTLKPTRRQQTICERHYRAERRRKDRHYLRRWHGPDFTPEQIRDRYIRAMWPSNPAKARRLWLARQEAA